MLLSHAPTALIRKWRRRIRRSLIAFSVARIRFATVTLSAFRADMREAEEVEGFGPALPASSTAFDRVTSELQYSGLRLVERETELAQTHA